MGPQTTVYVGLLAFFTLLFLVLKRLPEKIRPTVSSWNIAIASFGCLAFSSFRYFHEIHENHIQAGALFLVLLLGILFNPWFRKMRTGNSKALGIAIIIFGMVLYYFPESGTVEPQAPVTMDEANFNEPKR